MLFGLHIQHTDRIEHAQHSHAGIGEYGQPHGCDTEQTEDHNEELTQIGVLKEGTDATKFADNAYIFFDDVPDAPESNASTDTATKSTKASSVSFQPAAAEAEDDCCSGKITKPAQDTNAKA